MPQYQRAVEKSRAMQGISMLSSIAKAYELYYLANGVYATEFEELDVEIPFNGSTKFVDNSGIDTRSNKDWSFQIEKTGNGTTLYAARIEGRYKGAGFIYFASNDNSSVQQKQLQCFERKDAAKFLFDEDLPHGAYCGHIMHAAFYLDAAYGRYYKLP